jgi:hypothetical protein
MRRKNWAFSVLSLEDRFRQPVLKSRSILGPGPEEGGTGWEAPKTRSGWWADESARLGGWDRGRGMCLSLLSGSAV